MSARPPQPIVEVKHRYLAWDKPQFLIENTSRRPDTSHKPTLNSRNTRTRRDVKLSVGRSADPHTARHGPSTVDNRLGKSQQRLSSQLNSSGSTSSTPVIIADLWKPMQIRHSATQGKVELVNNATSRSHSQPALAFDNFNTRQEAQKLLQHSRSSVNQLLKNHRDRLNGSRYPVKTTEPSNTGYRDHRLEEVAGYQIYGGSLPKTSVYNLNERIVSSASDLSSLSFGSIDHEMTSIVIPTSPQRASGSRTSMQDYTNTGKPFSLLKDGYNVNEDRNSSMSGKVSSDHSRSNGLANLGNDNRTEITVTSRMEENDIKTRSPSMSVDNGRRQHFEDNIVESGASEVAGALQPFRLNASFPSPDSRQASRGVSLNIADKFSMVGQTNITEESAPDCSMCPMCRAQAALKTAGRGEENQEISGDLGKEERDTLSFPRMKSNNPHCVSSESHQENHQQSVVDSVENDQTSPQTLMEQGKRTARDNEEAGRSSIRLFPETSYNPPFLQSDKIDSYGNSEELISTKFQSNSETFKQNNVAEASMMDVNLKVRNRSVKKANARSHGRDFEPKIRDGAIVLKGRGLTRANRLEPTQNRPGPLQATKWYVDAALPTRQASPRRSTIRARGAEIPGIASSQYLPAASPSMNHRVPLIIWRKLQQLETPHHRDNRRMEYEYGSSLAGAAGYHGGGATRFNHQQPRVDPGDENFAPKSETLTSSLVIHIPTAGVTPEDVECPPNSPE